MKQLQLHMTSRLSRTQRGPGICFSSVNIAGGSLHYTHQLFLILQLHHAFLDGVLRDKANGIHWFCLANSVCALDCLHLNGGIPPRIQEEHVGCDLQ